MSTYTRVNWQDAPSTATPTDAANLNVMDAGIAAHDGGKLGGVQVIFQGSGSYAGFHLFVGPSTPTGATKGDVWIKTPF